MGRIIGLVIPIIFVISGTLWFVNTKVQPILPETIDASLVLITTIVSGTVSFLAGLNEIFDLVEKFQTHHNRQMLKMKFGQGPYDDATIEHSTRYYIRPKCSNIDPAQEKEIRHALVATREDLFDKVDQFLDHDKTQRHLLILADSGTGKTSFVLNYYAYNARKTKRKRHTIALVSLGMKNADERIKAVPDKYNTVIFLDALDEDVKAIEDHRSRIAKVMELCSDFKRVIITCRTQFFPSDEEIPIETGIMRLGAIRAGEKKQYEFWKLYLSPFDDNDVRTFINKRYPIRHLRTRKKALQIALQIPLLSARPMLLAHIPDIIASGTEITTTYQLYEIMVNAWYERESAWVDPKSLRQISKLLAVDIFTKREARGMERISKEELSTLAEKWEIDLSPWQVSGRSLLNRDSEGNFKFAHRSIMEFFISTSILKGTFPCWDIILTDQIKVFLIEALRIFYADTLLYSEEAYEELYVLQNFLLQNEITVQNSEKFPQEIQKLLELFTVLSYECINILKHCLDFYVRPKITAFEESGQLKPEFVDLLSSIINVESPNNIIEPLVRSTLHVNSLEASAILEEIQDFLADYSKGYVLGFLGFLLKQSESNIETIYRWSGHYNDILHIESGVAPEFNRFQIYIKPIDQIP
jgi:hypothetical protein